MKLATAFLSSNLAMRPLRADMGGHARVGSRMNIRLTDSRVRIRRCRHASARGIAILAALAAMLMPVTTVAQEEREKPKLETKVTRVLIPAKPHAAELAELIADVRKRSRLALSFQETPLGEIVKTISKLSGVHVSASKKTSQKRVTLEARGDLTLIELFDQLTRSGDLYAVVERSGVVRVLSAGEYRRLIDARGGSVGEPVPVPGYYPQIEFRMLAYAEKGKLDVDLTAEKKRLLAWLRQGENRKQVLQNPLRIGSYHGLAPDRGGRLSKGIRWFPYRITARDGKRFSYSHSRGPYTHATLALFSQERLTDGPKTKDDYLVEFLAVNIKERGFTTMDLNREKLSKSKDQIGRPVLLYEIKKGTAAAYSDLTARNIRRGMGMILDGYLFSAPTLLSRIPGRGMISGFSEAKIDEIVKALAR